MFGSAEPVAQSLVVQRLCGFEGLLIDGRGGKLSGMSRLRRLVLSDRFFFVTCRIVRHREALGETDFQQLARAMRERVAQTAAFAVCGSSSVRAGMLAESLDGTTCATKRRGPQDRWSALLNFR